MNRYRFCIPADICFSIEAPTPEEAAAKARDLVAEHYESLPISGVDNNLDMRAYFGEFEVGEHQVVDEDVLDECCDECGETIPIIVDGGLANRHHAESCSLFDPNED